MKQAFEQTKSGWQFTTQGWKAYRRKALPSALAARAAQGTGLPWGCDYCTASWWRGCHQKAGLASSSGRPTRNARCAAPKAGWRWRSGGCRTPSLHGRGAKGQAAVCCNAGAAAAARLLAAGCLGLGPRAGVIVTGRSSAQRAAHHRLRLELQEALRGGGCGAAAFSLNPGLLVCTETGYGP